MAESPQTDHGNDVARPGAAVAQTIEGGDPGAHERSGLLGGQLFRHQGESRRGRNHIVSIATIPGNTGDLGASLTGKKVPLTATVAITAVAAVPTNADSLANRPSGNVLANGIDEPNHLVAGNTRVLDAWK
jgi:hypothetical protein